MSVEFKVISRGTPGVAGGGSKKFYASANISGEKTIEDLTKDIEKISTVSGADIRAVLYALVDTIPTYLENGDVVRLAEIGSFRVSISSNGEKSAGEVTSRSIKKSKIIFTPGKKLKNTLENLTYKKKE